MTPHLSDEYLLSLAEAADDGGEGEHLATCSSCARRLAEARWQAAAAADVLADAGTWEGLDVDDELPMELTERLAGAESRVEAEVEADTRSAVVEVAALGDGPVWSWRERLDRFEPRPALVGVLLERAREALEREPRRAFEIASLAVEIAERLRDDDEMASARGEALTCRASARRYLGELPEALRDLDDADRAFDRNLLGDYLRSASGYVRAVVLYRMERYEAALELVRDVAATALRYGDRKRAAEARMVEANVAWELGRVGEARDLYLDLLAEAKAVGDEASQAYLLNNLALAEGDLGDLEAALTHAAASRQLLERLGLYARIPHASWMLGRTLVRNGAWEAGLDLLDEAWHGLEAQGQLLLAGSAALTLAEALLGLGRAAEAHAACLGLVERFARAQIPGAAQEALAYLQEAMATADSSVSPIRNVGDFFESLAGNPTLAFVRPD